VSGLSAGDTSRLDRVRRVLGDLVHRLVPLRPYAASFLISSLIVSRWFIPGTFISTGDMGSFIRRGWEPEVLSSWNHTISGAGSAAHTIGRLFEFGLIRFVGLFGGDEYTAQWLFYTCIYGLVAVGATYAARALVRNEPATIAAGTFAVLNGFFLTRLPNPLNIISVGTLAVVTGLALRVAAGKKLSAVWAGVAILPMSFLAFNPPMFVVALAWTAVGTPLLALAFYGWRAVGRLLRWFVPAAVWALALNAFWLVPFVFAYAGGGGAVSNADFRDPTAWSWSQAQNQIPNILTMVANWAWVKPQYLPFAAGLDEPWIVWARYLIPALLFLAPVLARPRLRRPALVILGLSIVFLGLAKGLQPPFAQVNLFLYNHAPGFWLFREPMSKLGQLLVLFIAMSIAIGLDGVWSRWRERTATSRVVWLRLQVVGAWGAVLIVVLQVHPLWTGRVIPDVRPMQPSAHVRVPDFWWEMSDRLNEDPRDGRVLVLPLDDYYQMPTTWGFAGVDSIANLLIQHPVVQPKPDGYFGEVPGFGGNIKAIETALLTGDLEAVPRLLEANQISRVIVRHDLVRGLPGRTFADDTVLQQAMDRTPGVTKVTEGSLDLYEVGDGDIPLVRAYDTVLPVPARPRAGAAVLGTVPTWQAIEARDEDPGIEDPRQDPGEALWTDEVVQWPVPAVAASRVPRTTVPLTGGTYTVAQRARAGAVLVPAVEGRELVLSDPTQVRIDGQVVSKRPDLRVPLPAVGEPLAVTAGARTVSLDGWGRDLLPGATAADPRPPYLPVAAATPLTVWAAAAEPARPSPPSEVYDCNNYEPRPARELGLSLRRLTDETGEVLRLSARDHAACTRIEVTDAVPGRTYRVRMQFRTLEGKRPEVCLWQLGTDGCDLVPRAPVSIGDWTSFEEFVTIDEIATGLQVVLYANVGLRHALTTTTEYRDISIEAVDPIVETTVFPPEVPQTRVRVDAGDYELSVTGGPSGTVLMPFGPLEDCYNTDDSGFEAAGLSVTKLEDEPQPAFQLTARDHRACIAAPVPDMGSSSLYELSYEARSVNLRNPQVCLYLRGPDQCAKIPTGGPWTDWTRYSTFVSADPRAVETRLYLYGLRDLKGKEKAVVEYRDVSLRPVAAPVDVVLVREQEETATPTVDSEVRSASSIAVSGSGLSPGKSTVVLAEAYAPGWTPTKDSGLDSSTHRTLQGWMNAWTTSAPDVDGVLNYGPDRYAQLAQKLFLVTVLAGVLWLAIRRPVRRWVGARWQRMKAAVRRRLGRGRQGADDA
jgi:arabinofuranan 3-O-arabinosyltransferase